MRVRAVSMKLYSRELICIQGRWSWFYRECYRAWWKIKPGNELYYANIWVNILFKEKETLKLLGFELQKATFEEFNCHASRLLKKKKLNLRLINYSKYFKAYSIGNDPLRMLFPATFKITSWLKKFASCRSIFFHFFLWFWKIFLHRSAVGEEIYFANNFLLKWLFWRYFIFIGKPSALCLRRELAIMKANARERNGRNEHCIGLW